jgi:hypothetical protein
VPGISLLNDHPANEIEFEIRDKKGKKAKESNR